MATLIENACQSLGLDHSMCRRKGYDGVGIIQGAAARMFGKYPRLCIFVVPFTKLTCALCVHVN